MKLPRLASILLLCSPAPTTYHPSALLPHSVCRCQNPFYEHKKTSLPGWLALPRTPELAFPLFTYPRPELLTSLASSSCLFKLQVVSNPGLVQHRIVWRLLLTDLLSWPPRPTLILNTLGATHPSSLLFQTCKVPTNLERFVGPRGSFS
jgi:hypothetical protein